MLKDITKHYVITHVLSVMDILEDNNNFTLSDSINGPVLSIFFALEMVAGFIANLFVIIVTCFHPKSWKQSSTIFLTNLLLADLVLVIAVMPFGIISTASGEWIFGETVEQKYSVCQFVGFIILYGVLLVTMTLAVISFDRFLSIIKPFLHKDYMKPHVATVIVLIVWVMCTILSTTPLYGFGRYHFAISYGLCVPQFEGQFAFMMYILLVMIVLVGCILVTSIWTCCFTRRFMQQNQLNTFNSNYYAIKLRRLIGIFGSLILASVLCFAPTLLVAAVAIVVNGIPTYVYAATTVCFMVITIANPLVQSCFRPEIKACLTSTSNHLTQCIQCSHISEDVVNNS